MNYEELNDEFNRYDMEDYDTMSTESKERLDYIEDVIKSRKSVNVETSSIFNESGYGTVSSNFSGTIGLNERFGGEIFQLSEFLNFTPKETDGPNSEELLSNLRRKFLNGKELGWVFKGKNIVVTRGGGGKLVYTKNKKPEFIKNLEEFKRIMKLANEEHVETASGETEKRIKLMDGDVPPPGVVDSVLSGSMETVIEVFEEKRYEVVSFGRDANISEDDIKEFAGVFRVAISGDRSRDTDNIQAVAIQAKTFLEKAEQETDLAKKQMIKTMGDSTSMYADKLRLELGLRPEGKEANDIINNEIENNDLTRLERFKKWAKENIAGMSAVGIAIASIVTSIVVTGRSAIKAGAKALGAFGNFFAGVAKTLSPLLAPLLSVLSTIISWGAKGLRWLSKNMWLLVIVAVYLIYDYWTEKKINKRILERYEH